MKTTPYFPAAAVFASITLIGAQLQAATVLELNPAVWLNAASITGVADGGALPTWTDSSGNGRNATQTLATRQPFFVANVTGANGMPAVRFNTQLQPMGIANQFMSFPTLLANTVASDLTLFVVSADSGTRSGTRAITVNTRSSSSSGNGFLFGYGASPAVESYAHTGASSNLGGVQTAAINGSGFNVLSLQRDGLLASIFNFTDTAVGSSTATWTNFVPSTLTTGTQIGTEGGANFFFGDIAEIIAYDRVLTSGENNDVVKYLGDKYSITTASAVPEPSHLAFLGGTLGILAVRRRRAVRF